MSLTDKINALTAYANEVTGESDTTLSEAVHTLADGYGQGGGGGDTIWPTLVERTVTEINDKDGLCATLGEDAFYSCTQLTSAVFPSATSVKSSAFSKCAKLSYVDLPSATSIETYAFNGCSVLPAVDLPNVARIKNNAFYGCNALKSLILRKSDAICTLSSSNAFTNTPIKFGTGYIYVPASLIETYKATYPWSGYVNQFRALEDYTVDGTTTGDLDPNKI